MTLLQWQKEVPLKTTLIDSTKLSLSVRRMRRGAGMILGSMSGVWGVDFGRYLWGGFGFVGILWLHKNGVMSVEAAFNGVVMVLGFDLHLYARVVVFVIVANRCWNRCVFYICSYSVGSAVVASIKALLRLTQDSHLPQCLSPSR